MINLDIIIFCFLFAVYTTNDITAQVNLIPIGGGPAPTCITIDVGTTISFSRNVTAPNPICDNNINFVNFDVSPVIDSSFMADNFNWTFSELGIYNIFCGAPSGALAGGQANVCYNVVPRPIPTVGEWGLILMSLVLLIIGSVWSRQNLFANQSL